MNLKFLLKGLSFSFLSTFAFAFIKNDCDEINEYIYGIDINYMYSGCNVNENGKVITLSIDNTCLPDKITNKLFSYDTITTLQYNVYSEDEHCFKGFPSSISNLKNLESFEVTGSKNIILDLSILKSVPIKKFYIKNSNFTQDNIDDIASIKTLEELEIDDCNIGDLNIDSLKNHEKLSSLILNVNDIEKVSLIGFNNLKKLDVKSVNQAIVNDITNTLNLEELYLADGTYLNLDALKKLNKLTYLNIDANTIQIGTLKGFQNLKKITVNGGIKQEYIDDISSINTLENIEILDLSENNLNFEFFKNLNKLSNLQIEYPSSKYNNTSLTIADNSFKYLNSLKKLILDGFDLTQNNIDEISTLNNLDELSLKNCNISKELKFDNFKNLINLSTLEFNNYKPLGNPLNEIPDSFYSLINLKKLVIHKNNITKFSEKLANLKNLEYLNLSSNSIDQEIPESINNLTNLKYVDFRFNLSVRGKTLTNQKLESCFYDESSFLCMEKKMNCFEEGYNFDPCSISSSRKFKDDCEEIKTYLSEKNIDYTEVIEECVVENEKLIKLKIDDSKLNEEDVNKILTFNTISNLDIYWSGNSNTISKINNFQNLENLYIYNINGDDLNLEPLNELSKLNSLGVSCPNNNNYFIVENSFKGLKNVKKLFFKEFKISQNNINEISTLVNLEELTLNNCSFSEFLNFSSISNLSKLTILDITGYNNFGKPLNNIPLAFYSLINLKKLTLSRQKINTISDKISELQNLETLIFSNNDIISIPESLNKLPNLKLINFSGNPKISGKTLINPSLETCLYDNSILLCKVKDMSCFGESDLLKPCSAQINTFATKTVTITRTKVKRYAPTNF